MSDVEARSLVRAIPSIATAGEWQATMTALGRLPADHAFALMVDVEPDTVERAFSKAVEWIATPVSVSASSFLRNMVCSFGRTHGCVKGSNRHDPARRHRRAPVGLIHHGILAVTVTPSCLGGTGHASVLTIGAMRATTLPRAPSSWDRLLTVGGGAYKVPVQAAVEGVTPLPTPFYTSKKTESAVITAWASEAADDRIQIPLWLVRWALLTDECEIDLVNT